MIVSRERLAAARRAAGPAAPSLGPVGPGPGPFAPAPVGPAPMPGPVAPGPVAPGPVLPGPGPAFVPAFVPPTPSPAFGPSPVPGPAPLPPAPLPPAPPLPVLPPLPAIPPPPPPPAPPAPIAPPAPAPFAPTPVPGPYVPPPAPTPGGVTPGGVTPAGPVAPGVDPGAHGGAAALREAYEQLAGTRRADLIIEPAPGHRVVRDVRDANDDARDAGELDARARALVATHAAVEAAQLARLVPEQQAAYARLQAATEQDPPARFALQVLLAEGRLTGGPANKDGLPLLAALERAAGGPVAGSIDAKRMVADMIQEIARPSCIAQKERGTCAATTTQIMLATQQPAEYVRLVAGLAGPEGRVVTAGGPTLTRYRGTESDDGTTRTISSRLYQTAVMALAIHEGRGERYRNTEDGQGLTYDETALAMRAVSGRKVEDLDLYNEAQRRDEAIARMERETAAGRQVQIGCNGHAMVVTAVERERGVVRVINPHGTEETIDLGTFKRGLSGANFYVD